MISVIFPLYNESQNVDRFLAEVVPELDALGETYELVLVDDGSKDDTVAAVQRLQTAIGEERARLIRHAHNRGLGAALRTGFAAALGDLCVTMDSDLTFAPSLVRTLLTRFREGDCDVVSGSPKLAGFGKDIPTYRVFVSKASTVVYSLMLGQRVTAVSPILRLYRTADVRELPLRASGFDINAEILFELLRRAKVVVEVPAPLTQRIHGESKLDYRRELQRHFRLVVRMASWRLREAVSE